MGHVILKIVEQLNIAHLGVDSHNYLLEGITIPKEFNRNLDLFLSIVVSNFNWGLVIVEIIFKVCQLIILVNLVLELR